MIDGKECAEWNHTAATMALIANCNRDPKRRRQPFQPREFHPYLRGRRKPPPAVTTRDLSVLRSVFVSGEADVNWWED